jgi:lipoate-protein ligase B
MVRSATSSSNNNSGSSGVYTELKQKIAALGFRVTGSPKTDHP